MKKDISNQQDIDSSNLNEQLNKQIKTLMKGKSATSIATKCGVSVSTITRIRNGENKRGLNTDLLSKIWDACKNNSDISLGELLSLNREVSDAYNNKELAESKEEHQELDDLEQKIQKRIINSGVLLRKVNEPYEIIPQIVLYPDLSYEIVFDDGKKTNILFYNQFYTRRAIQRYERYKKESPEEIIRYGNSFRKILAFNEFRTLRKEYNTSELVLVFNYEESFKQCVQYLKLLSNTENVTLALIDTKTGRFLQEVCLDDRKEGVLTKLGLVIA